MRVPSPASLLVEHPALPVPEVEGAVSESGGTGEGLLRDHKLSRRNRFRAALQLTAATAHLAEFDLWPARGAIAGASLHRGREGPTVVMGSFPYSLSDAVERLGGGEGAMEMLRTVALKRIADAVRLTVDEIEGVDEGPGLVFQAAVSRQLRELPRPVDLRTARALWALRWNELPPPEVGALQLWRAGRDESARRLAAALWCRLRREGRATWLWTAAMAINDTTPIPSLDEHGTIILVGTISHLQLATLGRWSQRPGCSAVAVGSFPNGWRAPTPHIDGERLFRHIGLTGMLPESARRILVHSRSRFDPMETTDRDALTLAVHRTVSPRSRGSAPSLRTPSEGALLDWLALSPTGLPADLVALHSGLATPQLEAARESLAVIDHNGVWRLPEPAQLGVDPRHLLVAGLIDIDQPMHLLHTALGSGDSSQLEAWARRELDQLRSLEVRDLLSMVRPGALGHEMQLMLAEACLSIFDLGGARRALAEVPADSAAPHRLWLQAIDREPGTPRKLPTLKEVRFNARVAAETALRILYDAHRTGSSELETAAHEVVETALANLSGDVRRRIEIECAFAERPDDLLDHSRWRGLIGRSSQLRLRLAHRRAMVCLDRGLTRSSRKILDLLSESLICPGQLGCVEIDRGAVALQEGRSRDAVSHQLRAYRLLQAGGFEHLTNVVLFDLAVADIDQLRIRTAKERLGMLAAIDPSDAFVIGEKARLALAVGDESSFRRYLSTFESNVCETDPRFSEGLALLRGVAYLLDGDHDRARDMLRQAGQEGRSWMTLNDSAAGLEISADLDDEWGVGRAAVYVEAVRNQRDIDCSRVNEDPEPANALAIALAERFAGAELNLTPDIRNAAVGHLRAAGLVGWAERLSGFHVRTGGLMTALARIVEGGGVDGVDAAHLDLLIRSLDLTGIEVFDAAVGQTIWRFGSGRPGAEHRHGRLGVLPLGGDFTSGPAGRLVLGILDLVLPPATGQRDAEVEETGFVGISNDAQSIRRELLELGPSHLPVLLVGETGVGKEVAARALHRISGRPGSLVSVNVAAIPGSLLEAELFGSVKGAFTGADRSRQGLAVAADGGTLFLDEIGDLDSNLQVKLLRFLESGEVRAVGSSRTLRVDVRIVSATHADLERRMREGLFRRDLYFRIAAPEVMVPPLRDRREDIGPLRDLFEREALSRHGLAKPVWSPGAEAALQNYHWPGNVRELRHVVEVAMVRAAGSIVRCDHLPISAPDLAPGGTWEEAQREFRRRFLSSALQRHRGNRSATARELGISRQALLYHLRNLGLNKRPKK